jgi:hypothetical protein
MEQSQILPYDSDDTVDFNVPDNAINRIAETVYFNNTEFTDEDGIEKTACIITGYIKDNQISKIKTITNLDASQIARIAFVVARNFDLMNDNKDFPTVLSVYKKISITSDVKSQLQMICGNDVANSIIKESYPNLQESTGQQATDVQRRTVTDYGGKNRRKKAINKAA